MDVPKSPLYPQIIETKTGKFSLLYTAIGLTLVIAMYSMWIPGILLLWFGNSIIRAIMLILLVAQFLIRKKSDFYLGILKSFHIHEYFSSYRVILDGEIAESKSLLCFHPHGIGSFGMGIFYLNPAKLKPIENIALCGSRALNNMPYSGILARLGGVEGVHPSNFKKMLAEGRNVIINPGGFECATNTNNSQDKTFIKNRKGFIKYCLEYAYKVHPVYIFNENKMYYTINGFEKIGMFLNKFKIPGCFYYGKLFFFPRYEIPLTVAIGEAIQFPLIEKPSKEDIDTYHQIYMDKLQTLFKKYAATSGGSETLEFL